MRLIGKGRSSEVYAMGYGVVRKYYEERWKMEVVSLKQERFNFYSLGVRVLSRGEDRGRYYYESEEVDMGGSMYEKVEGRDIILEKLRYINIPIGDITYNNIGRDRDGNWVIVDFD